MRKEATSPTWTHHKPTAAMTALSVPQSAYDCVPVFLSTSRDRNVNGPFTPNADSANISRHLCAVARFTFRMNSAFSFGNKRQRFAASSNRRSFYLLLAGFN
ncbi:hypothetical protein ILYODFUR_014341 [Ilyodon furcidens]|uniref:Uncharacterized protein n=1 Tax=Ilyodon furcidens TaxID=33524 RepID=A0ABV0VGD3_9TELE